MHERITTSARELRAIFNAHVLPRVLSGEIVELPLRPQRPAASSGQPTGASSQTLLYLDGREVVARAHCFVLPDGELGASGLPDPKAVLFEGQWLMAEP